MSRRFLFVAILVVIAAGMVQSINKSDDPPAAAPMATTPAVDAAAVAAQLRANAIANVKLSGFSWTKGGLDNVMLVDFTLTNKNPFPVKDLELTCFTAANSGTQLGQDKRVIFELIAPGKSKGMQKFNMGLIHSQAAGADCKVTDISVP